MPPTNLPSLSGAEVTGESMLLSSVPKRWTIPYGSKRFQVAALLILVLLSITITSLYVVSEHAFYYGDYSRSHLLAMGKAREFLETPRWALLGSVRESLHRDYNDVFALPLLPFLLAFGDSRLVFVLGVVLLFQLPFALVLAGIAAKLVRDDAVPAFWMTATVAVLTPMIWAPTLRGYPDVGGATLIASAILVYLWNPALSHWWQIPLTALCLAGAPLLRRPLAYPAIAVMASMLVHASAACTAERHWASAARRWLRIQARIAVTGGLAVLLLGLLARPFLRQLLTSDHADLYRSFAVPVGEGVRFYVLTYGLPTWLLAALGYTVGVARGALRSSAAAFLVFYGIYSLAQWTVLAPYNSIHFGLQFAIVLVPGIVAAIWALGQRGWGAQRLLALGGVLGYLVLNMGVALTPPGLATDSALRYLFSANHPPFVRHDYGELARLVEYLRTVTPPRGRVYVAAASATLSEQLLDNAERHLYGEHHRALRFLPTSAANTRDPYPLENLLRADVVVIATPWQSQEVPGAPPWEYHLRREAQTVVAAAWAAFAEEWNIARDFVKLPRVFVLANEVRVTVYRRTGATSTHDALRTLDAMRASLGFRSGGQGDWITLENPSQSWVKKARDATYSLRTHLGRSSGVPPRTTWVYIGGLPDGGRLNGLVSAPGPDCGDITLEIVGSTGGHPTGQELRLTHRGPGPLRLDVPLPPSSSRYLLLGVLGMDLGQSTGPCTTSIERLTVSGGRAGKSAYSEDGVVAEFGRRSGRRNLSRPRPRRRLRRPTQRGDSWGPDADARLPETILIVPCYNEAARLDLGSFRDFAKRQPDVRFLFVNDGSNDGTGPMLDALNFENSKAFGVHHLARNCGKAEAVRQGMLKACADDVAYVGFWDADLATPLDTIPEFCALLEQRPQLEMVFGSRVNLLGRNVRRNLSRHYAGRLFATAAAGVLRLPVYDTQCGAKLFRVTPDFVALLQAPFISRWIFDVEIIARLIRSRRRSARPQARDIIYELPLKEWHDVRGSKIRGRDFVIVAADLLRIYIAYMVR